MTRFIFLLLFVPIILSGQEQVSDISTYGVYSTTDIRFRVGFAKINDIQYLLEEKNELVISRYENGAFVEIGAIGNYSNKVRSGAYADPNRSLFEIRDGKYYRFFRDGLQIIDIEKVEVVYEYDFATEGYTYIAPIEIFEDRLYFHTGDSRIKVVLDMVTNTVQLVDAFIGKTSFVLEDRVLGQEGFSLAVYNAFTSEQLFSYEPEEGIRNYAWSKADKSIVFMQNDGRVGKIDEDFNVHLSDCTIEDISSIKSILYNGDKAIIAYPHVEAAAFQDSIVVFDYMTCNVDLSYITDHFPYFSNNILSYESEVPSTDYSIFGYRGHDPTDGPNEGLIYIVDHKKNTATPIHQISTIYNHTPIVHENALYMIGVDDSFWSSSDYLVKYDFESHAVSKLDPRDINASRYATLGYIEGDNLLSTFNTREEESAIWALTESEEFIEVQPLDFLINLGLGYVETVTPMDDRIYFINNTGVYSIFDNDDVLEYEFDRPAEALEFATNIEFARYEDKIAFMSSGESNDTPDFVTLNTSTGEVTKVSENNVTTNRATVIGPFIFYSDGFFHDILHYFDTKTGSIHTFEDLPFVSSYSFTEGENSAFFIDDIGFTGKVVYRIDYHTNHFRKIDICFERFTDVVAGYDDSYYLIDRGSSSEDSRIRLITKNGVVSTIYEGKGRFHDQVSAVGSDHPVTTICLRTDEELILISNDLYETHLTELPNIFSYNRRDIVINSKDECALLKTTVDEWTTQYWLFTPNQPLVEIDMTTRKLLAYSDLTNKHAILVLYDQDDLTTSLTRFDRQVQESTQFEMIDNACGRINPWVNGIRMSDYEYLFTTYCDMGYEPWVLNIENGSITLLDDIFPGTESSYPNHFTKFKDWIYLVLRRSDNSNQWYRIMTDFTSNIIEEVNAENQDLVLYPSPAQNSISIKSDLNKVNIYTMNGQKVLSQLDYKKDQPIDISSLENGPFILEASGKDKRLKTKKFIKIR